MRIPLLVGCLVGTLACGCSGMTATQIGQTAGGIAGAALAPGVGAPLGTLIGTLAGLVVDGQIDKVREQKERVSLQQELQRQGLSRTGPAEPHPLGEPTRVWVDERMEQGRLLAGHFDVRPVP